MENEEWTGTFIHKIKCLHCGLHFTVYSWKDDWKPRRCPECGNTEFFIHWMGKTNQQIYEFVPGKSEMVSIKTPLKTPDTSGV